MLSIGALANIKHTLQREIFNEGDEKILSICTVTKALKKKKAAVYLCIVSTAAPQSMVKIHQIKQQNEGDFKKKRSWTLQDLKYVDGKNANLKTHEFDIYFEKVFKWYAINLHERQNFLTVLHKQAMKYVKSGGNNIEFRNIPASWIQDKSPVKTKPEDNFNEVPKSPDSSTDDETEDFHILTEKEISELNRLVEESEFAIKDAELFIDQLGKKLGELDGANIQSVLASEKKVFTLMDEIEKAVKQADSFEKRLDSYDEILSHVRETMEKIGGKNAMIETANNNNIKLMTELNKVISQFDLSSANQHCLSEPDLKTHNGRVAAIEAGKALQKAMNGNIDSSLYRLTAVQDQIKRFEKLRAKFSLAISRHLNNLFIHLGNDLGDQQQPQQIDLALGSHSSVHKELRGYTELMHWMKMMGNKAYDGLTEVYTSSLSKIYERDLRIFFAQARQKLSNRHDSSREDLDSSVKGKSSTKQLVVPYGTLGVPKDQWAHSVERTDRKKYDEILEKVLTELEPVALQEQLFCIAFFQLDAQTPEVDNSPKEIQEKQVKQINEGVRSMMMKLFSSLERELLTFIQCLEPLDSFYSLYVLVRLTQHVMSAQDTQSFLSMTFASALVHVKRNMDKFMMQQIKSIQECKVPKRSKCGILPYVENFEEFANSTEEIFQKSERRTDMDKHYITIVETIFESISIHGNEHSKTPIQVIKMENYHHMWKLLAQLRISVLDDLKEDAKIRYKDAQKQYVTKYFGRPLEKLNLFFEGVQQKVAQGVKETEISYQMAFSKQELRKVISQYPAREVKKGLENLYKKVEKHLCEEESLLQVVWHAMLEEFIAQYKFLEEKIQKCYAGAMINLEFTIDDILTFFSDIARSH
ncbi:exocyst complex component 1 [Condylostylus longicornis]|uniref:exocyst complex component 1 n=1 Tax=Condylostylus longicornis TaxID=2530218 RepID=UPI00244DE00F|nr:exocyst complex component 1 [Condylostylus longicornis]